MLLREGDQSADRSDRDSGPVFVDFLDRRAKLEIRHQRIRFNARSLNNGPSAHFAGYGLNVITFQPVYAPSLIHRFYRTFSPSSTHITRERTMPGFLTRDEGSETSAGPRTCS